MRPPRHDRQSSVRGRAWRALAGPLFLGGALLFLAGCALAGCAHGRGTDAVDGSSAGGGPGSSTDAGPRSSAGGGPGSSTDQAGGATPEDAARRPLSLLGSEWVGPGVCYGPYREGQRPGGEEPTRAQLREDLELMTGRWQLLRVYESGGPVPDLLALIQEERLPFKVLLGAWIAREVDPATGEAIPGARAANAAQVAGAVKLAEAYPGVVVALVIGNETQVSWSAHRLPPDTLLGWLRTARRATRLPVATADDFGYWLTPQSVRVASACDFIVTHVHPMWNGVGLEDALAFTRDRYEAVTARHPEVPVVLGEVGWATSVADAGEEARLIRGEASEAAQRRFYAAYGAWVREARIPATWFEAFDEPWKGGDDPTEVEKHWGVFRADRTPKAALER